MYRKEKQKGSVTLETSIMLPIFFFLFMFIYGLFIVFTAHNQMTHALVQSSKSLSLDPYLTESIEALGDGESGFWGGFTDLVMDMSQVGSNSSFSSRKRWHAQESGSADNIAKQRFVGYFAGGSVSKAEEKLDALNIVGGLNGVTFKTKVDGERLTVTICYEIQYMFDAFGAGKIPMEQSITTRLWKGESD